MTDLDTHTLRTALRASAPDCAGPAFDAAEIITRGRRLRWRRRAAAAGGSVCLAAAVFGAVTGIGRLTTPPSGPAQHMVGPVSPARTASPPAPSPHRPYATLKPSPSATAVPATRPTGPTATPTPTPTASQPTSTPARAATAGPSASPSGGYRGTPAPSASRTTTSTEQPTPTPSTTPTAT
jgi:hypothetical protein